MRKVVVSLNVTRDGFMARTDGALDWHYRFWDDEMARAAALELGQADTLLFGRITFQAMAGYWQAIGNSVFGARDDADFAHMMNSHRKIVFSRTLRGSGNWYNSKLAGRNINGEISVLKNEPGRDILVYGSGKLVDSLVKNNLVDEFHLWVHPVIIEKGRPAFDPKPELLQISARAFDNGVVLEHYSSGRRAGSVLMPGNENQFKSCNDLVLSSQLLFPTSKPCTD